MAYERGCKWYIVAGRIKVPLLFCNEVQNYWFKSVANITIIVFQNLSMVAALSIS